MNYYLYIKGENMKITGEKDIDMYTKFGMMKT